MWVIFRINVLRAMISGEFGKDTDSFVEFYVNEYDACIKRGGDLLHGVPVINGNVQGMKDVMKEAMKKGQENGGENFNLLEEIYPSAFDAYWMGAELAPIPNPLLKPAGWIMTPPAPGTITNIGPNPIILALTSAAHKAEVELLKAAEDKIKSQTIDIDGLGSVNVYDTVQKIIKKEIVDPKILNRPEITTAKEIIKKLKEAKKKKPSIGSQIKKAFKIPFPKLPSKKKLMEEARKKAEEQAKEQIIKPIEDMLQEAIIQPIEAMIQQAVELADIIPNPKPTKAEIKQFVKDTINGVVPKISLPGISLPKIPKKEELKQMVKDAINGMIPDIPGFKLPKIPTLAQIESMIYDMVLKLVPNIPNIFFIPPTLVISANTNILVEPFITMAQTHLANTGGTLSVTSQYPTPLPPGPAFIQWSGYNVVNGPKIPLPTYTMKIPEVPDLGNIIKLPPLPQPDFSNVTQIVTLPNAPQLPNVSLPKLPTLPIVALPTLPSIPTINIPKI
jgi:hypothetical protein